MSVTSIRTHEKVKWAIFKSCLFRRVVCECDEWQISVPFLEFVYHITSKHIVTDSLGLRDVFSHRQLTRPTHTALHRDSTDSTNK
ncbi:hypothetical protein OUZ56_021886 [Daphnia magna]|uniref:Uncharacterized protein n=1 Tax=Daphnia magna TaxID=35525 RepID=A0ABR0AUQ7_9CRUS|nr:hypothetical protein OUZ56_021886 [Daphnia magna]